MLASGKQSSCMEVLCTKYKVKEDWLRAKPKKITSPTWRAIENAKNLIVKGACYLLGDGKSISVWEDPWIPWIEGFKPRPRIEVYSQLPLKLLERLKMLLWRIGADVIPTKVNLQRRIQQFDTSCSLCNSDEETYAHLFFHCPFAKAMWITVG